MTNKRTLTEFEPILFLLVFATAILPLFFLDYVVTGDGPCHFYNSQILYDWHFKGESQFYQPFLMLNRHIDPNWITNLVQVPLLAIFSVIWAEKLFFLLYLLTFSLGFRVLISTINPESLFLSPLGILFAWNHILMMGFTNNAWSVALWFWILAWWMKSFEKERPRQYLGLALLMVLIYLAHPIGLMFSIISIAAVTFFRGVGVGRSHRWDDVLNFYATQTVKFLLVSLPVIILFAHFFLRREWKPEVDSPSFSGILDGLLKLEALVNLSSKEESIAFALSLFLLAFLGYNVFLRIRDKQLEKNDGLLLLFILTLLIVVHPPKSFSGGLTIGVRLGMFPFLSLILWLAVGTFPRKVRIAVPMIALLFSTSFLIVRLPVQVKASELAAEIVSCKDFIEDRSILLALNYDWNGHSVEGEIIGDRIWLFRHFDCYLGLYRQLIISDNYEANFWYFPLIERWETNMHTQTSKEGINFDHRPPRADMLNYPQRTGGYNIDYVLLVSYRDEFADHEYTQEIFDQLNSAYSLVYRSAAGRAILYQRNQ